MNGFLRAHYGDPCRGCGYGWFLDPGQCRDMVGNAPDRFALLLLGRDGTERHVNLQWNAVAYVVHVADVLRVWSDRVAAAVLGNLESVVPYDEGALGEVRGYERLPVAGALWTLERAVGDWMAAEELAQSARMALNHPEQGLLELDGVRRIMAHEVEHHAADISLIVSP